MKQLKQELETSISTGIHANTDCTHTVITPKIPV